MRQLRSDLNLHSDCSSNRNLGCSSGHNTTDSSSSHILDYTSRTIAGHILGYTTVDHTAADRIASSDHSTTVTASSGRNIADSDRTLGYRTTDSPDSSRRSTCPAQISLQSDFHAHHIHHS